MKLRRITTVFISLFFIFSTYPATEAQIMNLKGRGNIGAFNIEGALYSPQNINWSFYDQMNFSINHQYLHTWNWQTCTTNVIKYGGFYDMINTYINEMINVFNSSYRNGIGQSLLLERYKTNLAAYGQRSTYQAEEYPLIGTEPIINQNPGYGYQNSDYNDFIDNFQNPQIKVKHCTPGVDAYFPANYIVSGLYENNEQTNCPEDAMNFSDIKNGIRNYRFYVKPRMRIPLSEIAYPDKEVVKIEMYAYDGTLINSATIIVNGSGMASGIYFARILVNDGKDFIAVKKMILIK